jgi:hypothetical protein
LVEEYESKFKSVQEFQFKKFGEKSAEAKTSGMGHRSREVRKKTRTRTVKMKCP